jgi:hypothetical protein
MDRMIPAAPIETRHGKSAKIGTLRYVMGSLLALAVLFGLFLLAGFEF